MQSNETDHQRCFHNHPMTIHFCIIRIVLLCCDTVCTSKAKHIHYLYYTWTAQLHFFSFCREIVCPFIWINVASSHQTCELYNLDLWNQGIKKLYRKHTLLFVEKCNQSNQTIKVFGHWDFIAMEIFTGASQYIRMSWKSSFISKFKVFV